MNQGPLPLIQLFGGAGLIVLVAIAGIAAAVTIIRNSIQKRKERP